MLEAMDGSSLDRWNALDAEAAAAAILPCNGSRAWAEAMARQRPFASGEAIFAAADEAWRALRLPDWTEAFNSHPRIGETHAGSASAQSLRWSAREQSDATPDERIRAALAEGNRAYEARFGRVFLVCATGKSAAQMLDLLEHRLHNDPQAELLEAVEQQRRITQLRLRRWLDLPAASCDDV